jgi:2-methylcitrate dehydratase PrpD
MPQLAHTRTAHASAAEPARPLAGELAARVLSFCQSDLDASIVAAAKTAIVDTLGVTLLGAREASTRMVRNTLGERVHGPARIFGSAEYASVLDAALVNGVASHALDFDDFTQDFGGHPSVPVVPGLFALAEARAASGAALLAAYVVGVETETRIAHAVHFHHYEKGWHPTSTLGVFGAAAAAAHLLGLDHARTTSALAMAASLASGIKANFGTCTKPLHVGHCTRSGVQAALLAEQGFDASPDALEHPQGFLEVYNGAGNYDVGAMLVPWFDPPLVCAPGISLKQFACCGSTHPAIYMALALRARHAPPADAIRAITVLTHPRRLPHTDNPDPGTALEAKFSMQYCVARALLDGEPRLAHFEGDAPFDPPVRRLMERVSAGAHPEMAHSADQAFGAEVIVEMNDGRRLSERVAHMPGRGPLHPMTRQELRDKFMDCAARSLPAARALQLFERLAELERVASVRELGALAGLD